MPPTKRPASKKSASEQASQGKKIISPVKKKEVFTPLTFDQSFRFTAFIYGSSGSGKTFMLRGLQEFSDLYPALILVCDQGHLSLKGIDSDKITLTAVSTYDQLEDIHTFLQEPNNSFKTVVIDNISELHRRFLIDKAKRRNREKGNSDLFGLVENDYGNARSKIMDVLAGYALNLPQNIIVNALAHEYVDNDRRYIKPKLFGQVAEEAPGLFDLVGYLTVYNPSGREKREAERLGKDIGSERRLYTEETAKIREARIRGKVLPPVIINPTWKSIYSTWQTNYNNM